MRIERQRQPSCFRFSNNADGKSRCDQSIPFVVVSAGRPAVRQQVQRWCRASKKLFVAATVVVVGRSCALVHWCICFVRHTQHPSRGDFFPQPDWQLINKRLIRAPQSTARETQWYESSSANSSFGHHNLTTRDTHWVGSSSIYGSFERHNRHTRLAPSAARVNLGVCWNLVN